MTDQTSKVISALRFPLAVLVIACHSNFLGQTQGLGTYMQLFFCEIVPHVAVPLFMLFSGMLFFRKGMPTSEEYGRQLLKRVRTLLVPYLLWSTISFVVMACRGEVTFTFLHWLQGLWDTSLWTGRFAIDIPGYPVNMPLWFIRDLMVLVLLAYPIGLLLVKTRGWALLLLAVWWFPGHEKFFGFGADSLFYFFAGAWISLKNVDILGWLRKVREPSYVFAAVMLAVDTVITFRLWDQTGELGFRWIPFNVFVISMMAAVLNIASSLVDRGRDTGLRRLAGTTFFLYAAHWVFLPSLQQALLRALAPVSAVGGIVLFWAFLAGYIALLLSAWQLLRRFAPRVLSFMTGGR